MKDSFSAYHPIVNFFYFTAMIVFSMFFVHPVFQGISLISAFIYSTILKGNKGFKLNLQLTLPILLFTALINPLFNHKGITILFYLKSGNPVTLESIFYGISSGVMLITVILWFGCYNTVMTSDKFIYIFGRTMPAMSLIFSMALRFIPRYIEQVKVISNSQKCIGKDVTQGNLMKKAENGIKILSILTTWALENAIETADSMKSRGYGLPNRSSFSTFRFDSRDRLCFSIMMFLMIIVLSGVSIGQSSMRFFPSIKCPAITFYSFLMYFAYLFLCIMPLAANIWEAAKWKYIESKI